MPSLLLLVLFAAAPAPCAIAARSAHPARPSHAVIGRASAASAGVARRSSASYPDGAGGTYFAWSDERFGDADVFLQRVDAAGQPLWNSEGVRICAISGQQSSPVLAGDGAGGVIVAWSDSRDVMRSTIYVQRVNSAGVPQWISNGWPVVYTSTSQQLSPVVASDGAGGAIVGWQDVTSGGSKAYVQRLNANGSPLWGPSGLPICAANGDQQIRGVTDVDHGGTVVVWQDFRMNQSRVYAQRLSLEGLSRWTTDGVPVTDLGYIQEMPVVLNDGAGGAVVAFSHTPSARIRAQRFDSLGTALWSTSSALVCDAAGSRGALELVPDGSGGVVLAWDDGRSPTWEVYLQRLDATGATLWNANGVEVPGQVGQDQVLAADGSGGAIVAWADVRASGVGLAYAQRVDGSGALAWDPDGVELCDETNGQTPVSLTSVAGGQAVVMWRDYRAGDVDYYGQTVDAAGTIHWQANGAPVAIYPGGQHDAVMTADGAGGVVLAWQEKLGGDYVTRAKRFAGDATVVWPATPVTTDVDQGPELPVAADGAGGALYAWFGVTGGTTALRAQRMGATGGRGWGDQGVKVCDGPDPGSLPYVVSDGAGGSIVTWMMSGSYGPLSAWAQRFDATGAPVWAGSGVELCPDSWYQTEAFPVSDGAGGAIVAWLEDRGSGTQIVAQRVDGAGNRKWDVDGVPLIEPAPGADYHVVVPDHSGGAILAWLGAVSDTATVFAQRVDVNGIARWGADGVRVSRTVSGMTRPSLAAYGDSGAYVAWLSFGDGNGHVRAQRLGGDGTPAWGLGGANLCTSTSAIDGLLATSGPSGDLTCAWSDDRSGVYRPFAARVTPAGALAWGSDGIPVATGTALGVADALVPDLADGVFVTWWGYPVDRGVDYLTHLGPAGAPLPGWPGAGVTPTLVSLVDAQAGPGWARIVWQVGGLSGSATVERCGDRAGWTAVGRAAPDGTGRVTFEDRGLVAGVRYGYRLRLPGDGTALTLGETWITVPAASRLALSGATPNPAAHGLVVGFTLPDAGPAQLELWDVGGRRVLAREVGSLGPGPHTLRLAADSGLRSGVYWIRLAHGGERLTARAVVIR